MSGPAAPWSAGPGGQATPATRPLLGGLDHEIGGLPCHPVQGTERHTEVVETANAVCIVVVLSLRPALCRHGSRLPFSRYSTNQTT